MHVTVALGLKPHLHARRQAVSAKQSAQVGPGLKVNKADYASNENINEDGVSLIGLLQTLW